MDNATDSIKEYADGVLYGLESGAVQHATETHYWLYIYKRNKKI